ncbi:MAG TPA: CHASE domain-containing protein, partial [Candidatus Omnitrophota bacterium]|nr:CHASE domain-containing protein [Candidatus Omnitrophota bacterium]
MAEGDLRHHLLDGRTMAILLPSLLATLVVWWGVASQGRELQQTRFRATVDEAVAEIVNRIDAYEQVLRAGSALFDASDDVVAGEWRRFVARLEIERRYPGIQGIGFARRVSPPDVTGHVDRIRATLYPDYRITPPGGRAIYFPIVFLEPLDRRNLRAIGYDMYAEPVRHAAMIRAAEQGRAIMSGKVTLVQEIGDDVQAGTLLYVPVYAHGSDLATVAARHAALQGFVYAPFRMADLFTAILGSRLDDLCVVVEDEGGGSQAELFANRPCEAGRLGERRTIDVNGRQWSVAFRATSRFETELGDRFYSYAVLVAGLAVTALLVVATQSLVAERRRREALIQSNL